MTSGGVYQEGSGDKNYFAGPVGFGTTTTAGRVVVYTGESGVTATYDTLPTGSITFCNNAVSAVVPSLVCRGSGSIGFSIVATRTDGEATTSPDMQFNVREDDNTDFSTTTQPAFQFTRYTTPLMTILRNGYIGIGTTQPTYGTLAVYQGGNKDSDGFGLFYAGTTTGRFYITGSPSNTLIIGRSVTPAIAVDGNANVGIGTLVPRGVFHTFGSLHYFQNNGNLITHLSASGTSTTGSTVIRSVASAGTFYLQSGRFTTNDSRGDFVFTSMNNGTEFLRITGSTGNVGIATASPFSKLHIYHGTNGDGTFLAGGILIENGAAAANAGEPALSFRNNALPAGNYIITGINQTLQGYSLAYGTSLTEGNTYLFVSSSGNIGISTTTPTSFKLQIAGNVGPNIDIAYDLGSTTLRWKTLYANEITASRFSDITASAMRVEGPFIQTNAINVRSYFLSPLGVGTSNSQSRGESCFFAYQNNSSITVGDIRNIESYVVSSTNGSQNVVGVYGGAVGAGTSRNITGNIIGVWGTASVWDNKATASYVVGGNFEASIGPQSLVSDSIYGLKASVISNYAGPGTSNTPTSYLLYLSATTGSAISSTWGIYQQGTSDKNIFRGNTAVGSGANNTHTFMVSGSAYFQYRANTGNSYIPFTDGNIYLSAAVINFRNAANSTIFVCDGTSWYPNSDATYDLGQVAKRWLNCYVASITGSAATFSGHLSAATKAFLIDHPTEPGKKLQYGSLESPYHGVRLTGEIVNVYGDEIIVDLPNHINGLVHEEGVNIQLTPRGTYAPLYVKSVDVANNKFVVGIGYPFSSSFYWSFTAVRKDVDPLLVEF